MFGPSESRSHCDRSGARDSVDGDCGGRCCGCVSATPCDVMSEALEVAEVVVDVGLTSPRASLATPTESSGAADGEDIARGAIRGPGVGGASGGVAREYAATGITGGGGRTMPERSPASTLRT